VANSGRPHLRAEMKLHNSPIHTWQVRLGKLNTFAQMWNRSTQLTISTTVYSVAATTTQKRYSIIKYVSKSKKPEIMLELKQICGIAADPSNGYGAAAACSQIAGEGMGN